MISGFLIAKCKKCNCIFAWHMDNFPFTDAEIIGTCDKCLWGISHKCINELQQIEREEK